MTRPAAAYEFGPFRLDPLARVLSLSERPIALAPKSFDLLQLMVERPGRVLKRDELIRELWPDTIVEEANLTFQVSTLRKALGEDGSKWIETVPKHGYRFMAPVREIREVRETPELSEASEPRRVPFDAVRELRGAHEAPPEDKSPAPAKAPARRARWFMASGLMPRLELAATLGVVALAAIAWLLRPPANEANEPASSGAPRASAAPLTAYQGWEGSPALSPDGSQVAFSWNGASGDNLDIYLKLVGPGEPHRLTTDPAEDISAAWSPDGREIAFLRETPDEKRGAIYVIPALGGSERRLAEIDATEFRSAPGNLLAWSPDGKWLAAVGRFDASAPSEVWLLSATTGERRRLTTAGKDQTGKDQIGDFGIAFSPDGRFLAVLRYVTRSIGDIHVLPLDPAAAYTARGPLVRITHEERLVGGPSWNARGDRIFYSTGGALSYRTLRMLAFDPAHPERRVEPVPLAAGEQATALSTAGGRLVYARADRDTNIWRLPLPGSADGEAPARLIASTFDDHNPDFSADGAKVTFTSTRSGTEEIWIANADGSEAAQMTSMGGANTSNSRWSPDGKTILFNSRRTGSSDLYLLDVATRGVTRITEDPTDEYEPRWSRDGKWIYFVSTRSGRPEVWKIGSTGASATAVQVTRQGGTAAFESADGRWLYYGKETRPMSIWRMPIDGGEETKVVDFLSYNFNFAVTAKGIYLLAARGGPSSIEFFDFATRKTAVLHKLARPPFFGFALAPDGRSVLFSQIDSRGSDLMVVENLP